MTNWDIIKIVNMLVNRDVNQMAFSADEYQTMINAQSLKLFKTKLGAPEEYRGTPNAQQGVGFSKKIDKDLNPFLVYERLPVNSGVLDLSSKLPAYVNAINPDPQMARGFDYLSPDELGDRMKNPITRPTLSDPVIYETGSNVFAVVPSAITYVYVSYYKYPTSASISISYNPTTLLPYYGPGASGGNSCVELEWDDINKIDIAYFIARDAGLNVGRNDVVSVANQIVHDK